MTILHMDDFSVYDTVRTSGSIDLTWLTRYYDVRQTTTNNLRYQDSITSEPYRRPVLKTTAATTGQRSVYLPLGQFLMEHDTITIGQKLVDFSPSSVAIGGLSIVNPASQQHVLAFGFSGIKSGFIKYVNSDNIVVEDSFTLPTSLSGHYDTIEWTFQKDANSRSEYRMFSLWVNNRPVYAGNIFCQVGAASALAARVLGGISTLANDATSVSGYITSGSNVTIPAYGTTDLVVTNGVRTGRVRVISRMPVGDIGPNTMNTSESVALHAELVNTAPPSESRYLTAVTAAAKEVMWANPYADLSSENVLAVAVRLAGRKNSPDAWDMVPLFKLGNQTHSAPAVITDLVPSFGAVILEKSPWTNLNWTPLEANNLQFGAEVA